MDEDETRAALNDIVAFIPNADKNWVHYQIERIRREGDGYWVRPRAVEYIKRIEAAIIIG